MQRTSLPALLFLIGVAIFSMASMAFAAQRPQTSGDPIIDAQWQQLAMSSNPVGSTPVDPNATPATGIFRAFGGTRRTPAQARALAPRTAAAPRRGTVAPQRTIDPAFLPKVVDDPTGKVPGTIVIDTAARYLYFVLPDGKARRYGVTVAWRGLCNARHRHHTEPCDGIEPPT